MEDLPVAVKMSWGAERNTTREEALAYFLLGLFRVNMPLVYGEGKNAFIRLQREIIKKSDDHSVFTWVAEGYRGQRGILARSPPSSVTLAGWKECVDHPRTVTNPAPTRWATKVSKLSFPLSSLLAIVKGITGAIKLPFRREF